MWNPTLPRKGKKANFFRVKFGRKADGLEVHLLALLNIFRLKMREVVEREIKNNKPT